MCGIVGLMAKNAVNQRLYDALTLLQHRGQDAAGIMTSDGARFFLRKGNGYVRDVFQARHMQRLQGNWGIGHVRYPTAGSSSEAEAQPIYVNSPYGLALAHNGNLTNAEALKQELYFSDKRHINTESDSEVLLNVFAHELQYLNSQKPTHDDFFEVVQRVHERCKGAYAAVVMVAGIGMIGFRDPHGIRPIILGVKEVDGEKEYMFASESVVLDALGFKCLGDLAPGEAVFIDSDRKTVSRKQCAKTSSYRSCIFEYVYLARPDSTIDGVNVYQVHIEMGKYLAKHIQEHPFAHDIDVVVPIPDTSRPIALELAHTLGLPYREGLIKNRYIARTFIMPGQGNRRKSVRQKLNAIACELQGKNVLLVDDSIVRGTTSREIIQMVRDAGAKKVYFASASPPVRFPNVYGIDMPSATDLVAANRNGDEICKEITADGLVYQSLDDLKASVRQFNPKLKDFEDSIFTGEYVTKDIDEAYLKSLAEKRKSTKETQDLTLKRLDMIDGG